MVDIPTRIIMSDTHGEPGVARYRDTPVATPQLASNGAVHRSSCTQAQVSVATLYGNPGFGAAMSGARRRIREESERGWDGRKDFEAQRVFAVHSFSIVAKSAKINVISSSTVRLCVPARHHCAQSGSPSRAHPG